MGFSLCVGPRDLVFEIIFKEESYLIINQGRLAYMFIPIVLVYICVIFLRLILRMKFL